MLSRHATVSVTLPPPLGPTVPIVQVAAPLTDERVAAGVQSRTSCPQGCHRRW